MTRKRNKFRKNETHATIEESEVKIEGNEEDKLVEEFAKQGGSNVMIIDPQKKTVKKVVVQKNLPKKLTKNQKKKLKAVVNRSMRKQKRSKLLEELAKVQIPSSELALMSSVAHIGTRNNKLTQLYNRPVEPSLKRAIDSLGDDNELEMQIRASMTSKGKRRKITRKMKPKIQKLEKKESEEEESSEDEEQQQAVQQEEDSDEEDEEIVVMGSEKVPVLKPAEKPAEIIEEKPQKVEKVETKKPKCVAKTTKPKEASSEPSRADLFVSVERDTKTQEAREKLPIYTEEGKVMEQVLSNDFVIICGSTGSGKTTQVPQFLYEYGFARKGMIGVTEPRIVATISMAERVGKEMTKFERDMTKTLEEHKEAIKKSLRKVSYQYRYGSTVNPDTKIKFMTDGTLLQEMKSDFWLRKYSVLVLDEAHERSMNTDMLIGLLSRIVLSRNKKAQKEPDKFSPLKVIIMSATLSVETFTENKKLFKKKPPVVNIAGRMFNVQLHYNKHTPVDNSHDTHATPNYIHAAYSKICKINRELPTGGILCFVTSKREVTILQRRLNKTFPQVPIKTDDKSEEVRVKLDDFKAEEEDRDDDVTNKSRVMMKQSDVTASNFEGNFEEYEDGDDEDDDESSWLPSNTENDKLMPLHVLPLYSGLKPHLQKRVFDPPPTGSRLCVIATNVAETSLTIPDIKYVVDTGKVKTPVYEKTGVQNFVVQDISKASADQRKGRAGRTSEGHVYRLYSSQVYDDKRDHEIPEIRMKPVDNIVLTLKEMGMKNVVGFPFPSPPEKKELLRSENLLVQLGAVKPADLDKIEDPKELEKAKLCGIISELGRMMAKYPLKPRYSRMIIDAIKLREERGNCDVIIYVIILVAALTTGELFYAPTDVVGDGDLAESRRETVKGNWETACKTFQQGKQSEMLGDFQMLLGAVGYTTCHVKEQMIEMCIREKSMKQVRQLIQKLQATYNRHQQADEVLWKPNLKPTSKQQLVHISKIILASFGDRVARKLPLNQSDDVKVRRKWKNAYERMGGEEPLFIHPCSSMYKDDYSKLPDFVVYHDIRTHQGGKLYMREVCQVLPEWLVEMCPNFCTFGDPLETPGPCFVDGKVKCHRRVSYGTWPLSRPYLVDYPEDSREHLTTKYKLFAKFLLEGKIVEAFNGDRTILKRNPSDIFSIYYNTPSSEIKKAVSPLLRSLIEKEVLTKESLLKEWKKNPTYLQQPIVDHWILPSQKNQVVLSWPPVNN